MLLLNAYTIYDNKALQWHPPYFASTDAAAARAFGDLANDPRTNVGAHPADYSLYCCGSFLDSNAQLTPLSPLRHVSDAVALLAIHQTGDLFKRGLPPEQQSGETYTPNYDLNGEKI